MSPHDGSFAPPALHLETAQEDCAFGSIGGILLVSWRTRMDADVIEKIAKYRNRLALADRLTGALHIAEERLALPRPDARAAAERHVTDSAVRAPACAVVVHGSGFTASAVRSIGTALFAMRRGPPTRLFGTEHDAVDWLLRNCEASVTSGQLLDACTRIREAKR